MAAFSFSHELTTQDTTSNWRLQSKKRLESSPSLLSSGGFASWTNVPPVGVPDPLIQDQLKRGRALLPGPRSALGSGVDPTYNTGGKKILSLPDHPPKFNEKLHFPHLSNSTSCDEQASRGLRQVPSRAKRMAAADSNPNSVVTELPRESTQRVRMYPGRNDVAYNCWEPQDLHKAYKGDWNLNTKYGFRKVSMLDNGEPKRSLEHPSAWPSHKEYPPDIDQGSGVSIDYALARHGGSFRSMPPKHPDLIISHENRIAASDPGRYNQSMRCRRPNY